MANYEVDFSDTEDASVAVVSADNIPRELWPVLRDIQYEALVAQLPGTSPERRSRAARVMRTDKPGGTYTHYIDSRVNPNAYVGKPGWWRPGQHIDNSQLAVLYRGGDVVGAVGVDSNVSFSHGEWEARLKRWMPPVHYLRFRESYIHPDWHRIDTSREQRTVSGLVVAGLWQILRQTNRFRGVAAYVVTNDPADAEMEGLTQVLGMVPEPMAGESGSDITGYPHDAVVTRMEDRVGRIKHRIEDLPGASAALGHVALLDGLKETA